MPLVLKWIQALLVGGALCVPCVLAQPSQAQVPVVSPDDVTTPDLELMQGTPEPLSLPVPTFPPVTEAEYIVREGDTLWSVALEIGMDLEDMPCAIGPQFRPDQPLVIGDSIAPIPAGAICHQTVAGETVATIAALYGVDPSRITDDPWNQLTALIDVDVPLIEGRYVRVLPVASTQDGAPKGYATGFLAYMLSLPVEVTPFMAYALGGPKAARAQAAVSLEGNPPDGWPYGSGRFTWPVYGWVSQGYRQDHRAVDIAAPLGTFVMAADRGVVVRAGWNNQGYGMFVIVDHNIDYVTLYSHMQDVYVEVGEVVAQGQVIGSVGSTGNSTGPHLHFELRDFGARINPLEALMR